MNCPEVSKTAERNLRASNWLVKIMFVLFIGIIGLLIVVMFFPVYTTDVPWRVEHTQYHRGDDVLVCLDRNSLLHIPATATRELVRHGLNGEHIEIAKTTWNIVLEKGDREVCVYYSIPDTDEVKHGGYTFEGVIEYNLWGIPRSVPWYTTEFIISD